MCLRACRTRRFFYREKDVFFHVPNLLQTMNMGDCHYGSTDVLELIDNSRQRRAARSVSQATDLFRRHRTFDSIQ